MFNLKTIYLLLYISMNIVQIMQHVHCTNVHTFTHVLFYAKFIEENMSFIREIQLRNDWQAVE